MNASQLLIVRRRHAGNFTQIPNSLIRNEHLSLKALGVGIKSASCSHSFAHWFSLFQHTVRTLGGGVQGISPWPTFIVATAAINIVGHYVFSDGTP